MELSKPEKPYDEYMEKFIGISVTGSGGAYYGKLTNIDGRRGIYTLNPYKGPDIKEGKLVQKLIKKNRKIEVSGNQGVDIFYCSKKTILKFCEEENEKTTKPNN